MKRIWLIVSLVVVLLASCAPVQVTEEPAVSVPDAFIIPDSLTTDWYQVTAGNTDMYVYKTEGIYDKDSGWVTFKYDDHKLLVILTTTPNPSNEDQSYFRKFDVQWVEGDLVVRHAICFDVNDYNLNLAGGYDNKYYGIVLPEANSLWEANQVVIDIYGCGFEGLTGDVIYLVHHHLVKSSALQEMNQP